MISSLKKLLFLLSLLLLCGFFWPKADWTSVNDRIDKLYPSVASITTDALKNQLQTKKDRYLIDVRPAEEYGVSHLPGAINVPDADQLELPKDAKIIVYCSVGLRSASFAKRLGNKGYTSVFNLRGSIFEWANKGYPLQRGEQSVTVVHPYNKKWGRLLNKSLHAYQVE